MAGEHLDLSSDETPGGGPADGSPVGRPYVGVRFDCCGIYTRVYVNRERTAYEGRCPRCARPVRLTIGPGGTDNRFFTAR